MDANPDTHPQVDPSPDGDRPQEPSPVDLCRWGDDGGPLWDEPRED